MSFIGPSVCPCVCLYVFCRCNEHALLIWMSSVRREMSMCLLVWNKSLRILCVWLCGLPGPECVCVCGWGGGGPVYETEMGSCPSLIFNPPPFPLMCHWCQLVCEKTCFPGNTSPNLSQVLKKNPKPNKIKRQMPTGVYLRNAAHTGL